MEDIFPDLLQKIKVAFENARRESEMKGLPSLGILKED